MVHLLHNTTREHLLDYFKARSQEGGIGQIHIDLGKRSIDAMSKILQFNIYNIKPGAQSSNIVVPGKDPLAPIRYSCEFWAAHLCEFDARRKLQPSSVEEISAFLKENLLHWLEALSLIHKISGAIISVKMLLTLVQVRYFATIHVNPSTNI